METSLLGSSSEKWWNEPKIWIIVAGSVVGLILFIVAIVFFVKIIKKVIKSSKQDDNESKNYSSESNPSGNAIVTSYGVQQKPTSNPHGAHQKPLSNQYGVHQKPISIPYGVRQNLVSNQYGSHLPASLTKEYNQTDSPLTVKQKPVNIKLSNFRPVPTFTNETD